MDVFGIFVIASFMCLIVTLVVMTIVKKIKKSQEYKRYSAYYVAEKSKDLGLVSKVLGDKPKNHVLTNTYDAWKNHNCQDLFDTGRMSSVIGSRCEIPSIDYSLCQMEVNETQEKYLENLPKHKTRVKLRNKRKGKR